MIEKNEHSNRIMTAQEVRCFLKLPLSTLYELAAKGRIRAVKCGRQWRFLYSDVMAYLLGVSSLSVEGVSKTNSERRKTPRLLTEISCELHGTLPHGDLTSFQGVITDLSESGLCLSVDHSLINERMARLKTGHPVQVHFQLPAFSSDSLIVQGRLVYQRRTDGRRCGIKFRLLNSEDQERIRTYVG